MNKKTILIIFAVIAIALLGYWIIPASLPLVFALFTAWILDPAVRMLQKHTRVKRRPAIFIIFSLFLILLGSASYFIVTKVITEGIQLVGNFPSYIAQISNAWQSISIKIESLSENLPAEFVTGINERVNTFLESANSELLTPSDIKNFATNFVTFVPQYLISIIVYLIGLMLFMFELPKLKERAYSHLKPETKEKVQFMVARLSFVFFGFFKAQFLVSIIIFIVALIGLLIIAPEVALVMALMIWIVDFIPFIGSIVILLPWALVQFILGDVATGTQLTILAVILLTIRRTVEPKVMGHHIGLSALSTLISMYIGLKLLGIVGIIVGPLLIIVFNSARETGIIKFNFKI